MNHRIAAVVFSVLAAGSLHAGEGAQTSPTNRVVEAIAMLKGATNYSWTTTLVMPDMQFTPGPVKGQADNSGLAKISQDFNDTTTEIVLRGDKVATKGDDGWDLVSADGGMENFRALALARNGAAAQEAEWTLKAVKELKEADGALTGELTSDGATDLLSFGPRRTSTNAPANGFPPPKDAKGTAKFWIKDGMLAKFEAHLHGTVSFGDNDTELDLTRTVEIQNVGTTKLDIPDDARKKLEPKAESKPDAK